MQGSASGEHPSKGPKLKQHLLMVGADPGRGVEGGSGAGLLLILSPCSISEQGTTIPISLCIFFLLPFLFP